MAGDVSRGDAARRHLGATRRGRRPRPTGRAARGGATLGSAGPHLLGAVPGLDWLKVYLASATLAACELGVRLVPVVVGWAGWAGAFMMLAAGPLLGAAAMLLLRADPASARLAGGRG